MPLNFERSFLTETAVFILRGVNDEITYQGLAHRAGVTIERIKTVIPSARRILQNEKIIFGVITGVGLKRLGEADKARKTEVVKQKIARAAGRGEKEAAMIDMEKLPSSDQLMVTTNRTIFHAIRRHALVKADPPSTDTSKIIRLEATRRADCEP